MKNKQIVITRAAHQANELAELLRSYGAIPLLYPCIEVKPADDPAPLERALGNLAAFDWLVLTSTNTVYVLEEMLHKLRVTLPDSLRVAAVGTSTSREAERALSVTVDLLPDEFTAEALGAHLAADTPAGTRFLLPQSAIAKPDLAETLTQSGGDVTVIPAYTVVTGRGGVDLPLLLVEERVHAITFTSSSTVQHFLNRMGENGGDFDLLELIPIACIGSVTAETARRNGLKNIIVPEEHTLSGMVSALADYFSRE